MCMCVVCVCTFVCACVWTCVIALMCTYSCVDWWAAQSVCAHNAHVCMCVCVCACVRACVGGKGVYICAQLFSTIVEHKCKAYFVLSNTVCACASWRNEHTQYIYAKSAVHTWLGHMPCRFSRVGQDHIYVQCLKGDSLAEIYQIYVGLARTVCVHRTRPCVWYFPCEKYRIHTVISVVHLTLDGVNGKWRWRRN